MKNIDFKKFHDGLLKSVELIDESESIKLKFLLYGGVMVALIFDGVVAFRVNDLVNQNVISRIVCSPSKELQGQVLGEWLNWVTSFSDSSSWLTPEKKIEFLKKIDDGNLNFLIIEPSAGAEIACLFQRVREIHCL